MSAKKNPNSRLITVAIVALVAVIAIVVAVFAMNNPSVQAPSESGQSASTAPQSSESQSGTNDNVKVPVVGSVIVVNKAGTTVESTTPTEHALDVTFDYTCVYCADFETTYYDMIRVSTESGKMTYVARPVSILSGDEIGSSSYLSSKQTKLAIIGYYVAQAQPSKFLALNYTVFANYSNISSYSDKMGTEILKAAGVDELVAESAIKASNDSEWQKFVSDSTSKIVNDSSRDFKGTPQIMIEGSELPSSINWLNDTNSFINFLVDKGIVPAQ